MMTPLMTRRPFEWLSELSVSKKIALGFTIVLGLHLSVVAHGHYGLRRADLARETQEALRVQVETFYEIDRTLAELERNVLLFAFSGYHGPELRVESLQSQLGQTLDRIEHDTELSTDIVDETTLGKMRQHLSRHSDIFAAVVADRGKRRDLLEHELAGHARDFEDALARLGEQALNDPRMLQATNAFRSAQLSAVTFARSPDSSHVREAQNSLAEATRLLEATRQTTQQQTIALIGSVNAYGQSFIQMVQATRGYLHLVNVVLTGESEEFLWLTRQARTACMDHADSLTARIEADAARYQAMNNVVSVLTIALGVFASWLIARNIAPPLLAIANTFERLAAGEPCETIPGADRRDELGVLAHAAEVFRSRAEQTERLLGEATRVKELERQVAHSQKMESIGQLAAGIAHEVNTPMQAVVTNVQYLSYASEMLLATVSDLAAACDRPDAGGEAWRRDIESMLEQSGAQEAITEVPQAIEDTAAAADQVVSIVGAMRTMSHPGAVKMCEVDLNQIIRDSSVVTQNRWKEIATLEFELEEGLPNPLANSSAICQVMLNLIVNAADALSATCDQEQPGVITLRSYSDLDSVYIEVQDSGEGVPEELREKIFDPFFTTKGVGKGTGQGLSLCYDVVVRQHGGEVSVEDGVASGAVFVVRLPLGEPETDAPAQAQAARLAAGSIS